MPHDPVHGMLITISAAIAVGAMLIVIARRVHLPAVVLLLGGGVLLGPAVWGDHALLRPELLGDGLRVIVALAVGLILFEGGLTLDPSGYKSAPRMIKRLLTLGVLVTWLGTSVTLAVIVGLEMRLAVLAASLVIVTGPTVIGPLLKRVRIAPKLHAILHWEGVLIDPIGVFIALLCFEFVVAGESGQSAAMNLVVRVVAGLGLGTAGGLLIAFLMERRVVPDEMVNVFALAAAVLIFGVAEVVRPEAGLLAVTVAGFVFGVRGSFRLREVRRFKGEITDLLIGMLFMLLCARLTFEQFASFGVGGLLAVAVVMVVIRPLSIELCSLRLGLTRREKTFLGWIAPRGIVAASMASLFAIRMQSALTGDGAGEGGAGGSADASRFVETFTYAVIIATIVLHGLTAVPLARVLGLRRAEPVGWLLVGSHVFARSIARFIAERGDTTVVLVDTNERAVREARQEGLVAFEADAFDETLAERDALQGVGNLLALTDNADLNIRLCHEWAATFGSAHLYRWSPTSATGARGDGREAGDGPPAERAAPGVVVFGALPRPLLVAGELERGEATLIESKTSRCGTATPILAWDDGRLAFDPARDAEVIVALTLHLARSADYLGRALDTRLVTTLDVSDVEAVFAAMLDVVVEHYADVPRDATLADLLEREAGFPSTIGGGVAAPHAYCSALEGHRCVIARIADGVDFGAQDGERVRLVFLVLSPGGDPEGHLATLGEIHSLAARHSVREQLLAAETPDQIVRVARRATRSSRV